MFVSLVFAAALAGTDAFDAGAVKTAESGIEASCGKKLSLSVRWESFGEDTDGAQRLMDDGLAFLTKSMATVCGDKVLAEKLRSGVKAIKLSQAYGAADPVIYITQSNLVIEYMWVKGEPAPDVALVAAEITSRLNGEEAEAP